jgi:cytochrome c-type biogenesis protein
VKNVPQNARNSVPLPGGKNSPSMPLHLRGLCCCLLPASVQGVGWAPPAAGGGLMPLSFAGVPAPPSSRPAWLHHCTFSRNGLTTMRSVRAAFVVAALPRRTARPAGGARSKRAGGATGVFCPAWGQQGGGPARAANALFEVEQAVSATVAAELTHVSPTSALLLFVAGILTSLSPCALSVLPLTVGYIGGVGGQGGTLLPSTAFSLGLASSLSLLGLAAAFLGQVYGAESGGTVPTLLALASSGLFVTMGLALLEILPLPQLLPSSAVRLGQAEGGLKGLGLSFVFGASTALVASPCATPVLASLLAYITSSGTDPAVGAALLFAYSLGYTSPIFAAGVATGTAKELVQLKTKFLWVTPASGSMLLAYGTYSALDHLFPQ